MSEIKITRAKVVEEVSVKIRTEEYGAEGVDFVDQDEFYLFGINAEGKLVLYEGVESDFFQTDENGYIVVERG